MSDTLYEYYDTGADGTCQIYGATWKAQTFTPDIAHNITSVALLLYRIGSPGTVTVSIRDTDVDGHPTGADLCSGTTNGNTLTTSSSGIWREIVFTSSIKLNAGVKYAIVAKAPSGNLSNRAGWRDDYTSPTYDKGNVENSKDSGSTWETWNYDNLFREYGIPCYQDIGLRIYNQSIGAEALTTHKARIRKGSTTYGLPLVAITDSNASKIRIYDGSSIKAFVKV